VKKSRVVDAVEDGPQRLLRPVLLVQCLAHATAVVRDAAAVEHDLELAGVQTRRTVRPI
jgi:hypothetical protein